MDKMDKFDLGLFLDEGKEIDIALGYLNDAETEKYKDLLSRLIRCAYDVQTNKHLKKEHLEVFEEGMRQSKELIFYTYSGNCVNRLSHHFEEVQILYDRLVNGKSCGLRFNAVTLMLGNPSGNIVSGVLEKCYNDKSGKVRGKVADVCLRRGLRQMLPLLERQHEIECDNNVKYELHCAIELLKHGYLLERGENGRVSLTFNMGVSTRFFDGKYLDTYPIEDIVMSYRDKNKAPWE